MKHNLNQDPIAKLHRHLLQNKEMKILWVLQIHFKNCI